MKVLQLQSTVTTFLKSTHLSNLIHYFISLRVDFFFLLFFDLFYKLLQVIQFVKAYYQISLPMVQILLILSSKLRRGVRNYNFSALELKYIP